MADNGSVDEQTVQFEQQALVHLDKIYNAAVRLTGSVPDAEDLVQDTFLNAFRFFHRFRPDSNMLAWLFKIMKNGHINRFRQKRREPNVISNSPISGTGDRYIEPKDSGRNPEEALFDPLFGDEVEQAISGLPDEFRWVVVLSDIEELPYKEIADILECPIGTVRSRLSRGRQLLRKQLWGYAKMHGFITEDAPYEL